MTEVLAWAVIIILALAALIFIPRLLMKQAYSRVIKIFQQNNAINDKNAKTIDELGLRPPTFSQRMFSARNYKPQALDFLIKAEIVQTTEDGKLYLSEDKLASSKLKNR